jgi:Zn-finger nucleic acid-binding protein
LTIPQIRHVLGDQVATRLLRLLRLSRQACRHGCPFCDKRLIVVCTQEPPLEVEACPSCNVAWFDDPTYETLPQLTTETMNSVASQATELIALDRLKELKEREEAKRREARKRRPLHRLWDAHADNPPRP